MRAPFDGMVAARLTPEHASVAPAKPVLRPHDLSGTQVEIAIPERLSLASDGFQQMRFSAALPGRDAIPLRPVAFQPETAAVVQSHRVTPALPSDVGELLPGASLTVTAHVPAPARGMPVPATALLVTTDRRAEVMVVEGGNAPTVRRFPVTLKAPSGSGFMIEGLPERAEIVAAGAHLLRDGQAVRRFGPLTHTEN